MGYRKLRVVSQKKVLAESCTLSSIVFQGEFNIYMYCYIPDSREKWLQFSLEFIKGSRHLEL